MNHNPWYPLTNVFVQDLISVLYLISAWSSSRRASAIRHPRRGPSWTTISSSRLPIIITLRYILSVFLWPGNTARGVIWRGPEVAQGHQEDHGQLPPVDREGRRGLGDPTWCNFPRIEPVGGEEDSYQVQLKASTPIMVFRMRPVVSMLIKSFQ